MNKAKEILSKSKNRVIMVAVILVTVVVILVLEAMVSKDKKNADNVDATEEEITTLEENTALEEFTIAEDDETISLEDVTADEELGNIDDDVSVDDVQVNEELPYQIRVNRVQNCITVYKQDKNGEYTVPFKAIVCSTGKNLGDTPLGDFNTLISYEWLLMVDGSYGQFAYRYYGSILFHSVPYYSRSKDNLEYKEFNKLGEAASLGCVRVCVRDAIWLVDNCPVGTEVIVYDDETSPGPLGKPEMIKIPEDSPYRGWDPTDPDPENPWNQFSAEIQVEDTVNIAVNKYSMDTIVERIGATATDTCGNDITDKIKAGGSVNFDKIGKNTLILTVKDAIGKTDTKIVTINVEQSEVTTAKPTTTARPTTTTAAPTTTVEETTTTPETTTAAATTAQSTTQPASTKKQTATTQTTTKKQTTTAQQTTTEQQTTTAKKTVQLKFSTTNKEVIAGQYSSLSAVLKDMGCQAVYSDGTVVSDASSRTTAVSGTYDLNQEGDYPIQVRYTDSNGISGQAVSITIHVVKPVMVTFTTTEIEVSAGEYEASGVSAVLTKMGIAATDSRGNAISNPAALATVREPVDLNTPGTYQVSVTVTDTYGVQSDATEIVIHVK